LQQLGLDGRRDLSDLVEENGGARVGKLELARFRPASSVKAPRSYPNSSLSSNSSGNAAQFTFTNGRFRL
jgi:hypothetical protein